MGNSAMAASPDRAMLWAPRLLAVAVSLFLGIFALDAFSGAGTFTEALPDFVVHLLPSMIVLAVVAAAWHREWIGAAAFIVLSAAYAILARSHLSWIAAISGPLLAVGLLYWWDWEHRRSAA